MGFGYCGLYALFGVVVYCVEAYDCVKTAVDVGQGFHVTFY